MYHRTPIVVIAHRAYKQKKRHVILVNATKHLVPNNDQCTGELRGGFESAVESAESS